MHSNIENIEVKELTNPQDFKVYEVSYTKEGTTYRKKVTKAMNVVKILIYHREKDAFVLVKQFRPLVYINLPDKAIRYELCGGREDKTGLSSEEVAKEEVLEETGYKVEKLEKITTLVTGGTMTLFYAEVDESMRVHNGGGLEDENIDLVYLPVNEAKTFMFDESKSKRPGLMFSFCWFLSNKCRNI